MFKNLIVYRIDAAWAAPDAAAFEQALDPARYVPCTPTQPESQGWVEPRGDDHGPLLEIVGGQWILKAKHESKGVPASVVRERLDERLEQIERETGRKPGGKQKKELKEEVVLDLLPHAFGKKSTTVVWIDPQARLLVIGAGSIKKADRISTALIETLARAGTPPKLQLLQTALSPATAMSGWLSEREAPAGFTIDRDCELKQPDESKASVRYSRHPLEIDEVVEHIQQGKLPTRLAMTWDGRVSFILGDDMSLKKLELLDVVLEGRGDKDDAGGFDADVAITTGELGRLLPDLFDALGGEARPSTEAAPPVATQPPALRSAA